MICVFGSLDDRQTWDKGHATDIKTTLQKEFPIPHGHMLRPHLLLLAKERNWDEGDACHQEEDFEEKKKVEQVGGGLPQLERGAPSLNHLLKSIVNVKFHIRLSFCRMGILAVWHHFFQMRQYLLHWWLYVWLTYRNLRLAISHIWQFSHRASRSVWSPRSNWSPRSFWSPWRVWSHWSVWSLLLVHVVRSHNWHNWPIA